MSNPLIPATFLDAGSGTLVFSGLGIRRFTVVCMEKMMQVVSITIALSTLFHVLKIVHLLVPTSVPGPPRTLK